MEGHKPALHRDKEGKAQDIGDKKSSTDTVELRDKANYPIRGTITFYCFWFPMKYGSQNWEG